MSVHALLLRKLCVLGLALAVTNTTVAAKEVVFDLASASVADIQQAVDAGALSYETLVQRYLARIAAYDDAGPRFNAILEINPRAVEIARALDEEYRTRGRRSPLHGIPIVVKDTVDVHDIPSAGGNVGLAGTFPDHDATLVRKLREAGAIILAKGNLDEFNLGSEGISSIGGQTANPYDPTRNPGGSSSGPAVAVNVGFATLGVATETGASIRSPASNNSLVGIAPSQGLVSRAGIIVISFSHDRAGPHAKSVADAALLLSHMRGLDPDDLMTHDALGTDRREPYTDALDPAGLAGMRIGVLEDLFRKGEAFAPVNEQIRGEIDRMRDAGAVMVPGLTLGMDLVAFFPQIRHSVPEFRAGFDAYLRRRGPTSPFQSLDELQASGRYLKDVEWSFQRTLPTAELEWDPNYLARLKNRRTLRDLLTDLMDRHQLDALVYPFKSLTAPPLGTGDRGPRDNPVSSGTGLPAIVLPAGVAADGLPISLELLGRRFSERSLIRIASGYEAVSRHRLAPSTAPPLEGDRFTYEVPDDVAASGPAED